MSMKFKMKKAPLNHDHMNKSCVIECPNCVMEKTVWRAGGAWYISREEM
jgi:hypothetical protein